MSLIANPQTAKEVLKMSDGTLTLDDVLDEIGWTTRWEEKGEEAKAIKIAQNLLKKGWSVEETAQTAELDLDTVKSLYTVIQQAGT
jgi:predicted transposase YdaD